MRPMQPMVQRSAWNCYAVGSLRSCSSLLRGEPPPAPRWTTPRPRPVRNRAIPNRGSTACRAASPPCQQSGRTIDYAANCCVAAAANKAVHAQASDVREGDSGRGNVGMWHLDAAIDQCLRQGIVDLIGISRGAPQDT